MKPTFEIDGARFSDMLGFTAEIVTALHLDYRWDNPRPFVLDAFNDVLRGGFGTPEGGFIIVWKNADLSKQRLGSELFDKLVGIIRAHCTGGSEDEDDLELILA